MKKHFLLITFYTLLVTFLISGCSKKVNKEEFKGKKVITLWETYNEEEHNVFLEIVKMFEQKNPDIKIKVQRIPWSGHMPKLLVSMITHTSPDIARVDVAWMPRLVLSRTVCDLTDYGALELAKDLVPAAVGSCIFPEMFYTQGSQSSTKHIFGLPDQTTGVALFYNKKMFRNAGIVNPPQNWDEFYKIAKSLTRDTNHDGKIDQYGFGMWNGLWWSFPFFNTFGVKFLDDSGRKCLLDSDEMYQVVKYMKKLYDDKVEGGAWIVGSINPDMGFMNGIYAMIFSGPWNIKRFKESKIDFGITLIPKGKAGTSTNVGGTNMVILKETKYPKECYEFLKFLVSEKIQIYWAEKLGQIPVNLKSAEKIDFSKNPEIKIFIEQMKYAIPRPRVIDYDSLEEIISQELYTMLSGEKDKDQEKNIEFGIKDAVQRINDKLLRELN